MNTSGLKLYSIGIVRTTKDRTSDYIEVVPIEELPGISGSIDSEEQIEVMENNLPDKTGSIKASKVVGDIFLVAKWLPFSDSNRMSSPDVVKGETVIIFRYMDTDEYHWCTMFREPGLRRLETVTHAYSDLKEGVTEFDYNSSYSLTVSTHDKYIKLHTSKSDGEPYVYDMILDTRNGKLTVKDDIENSVVMDSALSKVTITTNEDVEVNTKRVVVNTEETVTVNAKSDVVVNTDSNATVNAGGTIGLISSAVNITGPVTFGSTISVNGHASFNGGTSGDRT